MHMSNMHSMDADGEDGQDAGRDRYDAATADLHRASCARQPTAGVIAAIRPRSSPPRRPAVAAVAPRPWQPRPAAPQCHGPRGAGCRGRGSGATDPGPRQCRSMGKWGIFSPCALLGFAMRIWLTRVFPYGPIDLSFLGFLAFWAQNSSCVSCHMSGDNFASNFRPISALAVWNPANVSAELRGSSS